MASFTLHPARTALVVIDMTKGVLSLPHPVQEVLAELAPELGPQPLDHLITKHQWGAFFGADLDLQLRCRKIETIVLCGIAIGFGVDTTAREAYEHGYQQVFAEDAMNALSEEEHRYVCTHIFPRSGRLRSTDEIAAALRGTQRVG